MSAALSVLVTDYARRLARVETVDEAKRFHDKASALLAFAKSAKRGLQIQNRVALLKTQAECRCGELIREIERSQGKNGSGLRATLARSGIALRTAYRWQTMARVPETRIREIWVEATAKEEEFTSATIYREALSCLNVRKPMPAIPPGIYRVLYADPPWEYEGSLPWYYGPARRHYPTMALEEICQMKLPAIAEDAVLFLWIPVPQLEKGFTVCGAWGFKYKTHFVWHKERHNYGSFVSVRHELLLIATKGSCLPNGVHIDAGGVERKQLFSSVQSIGRTRHSEKPPRFREIIDAMYPTGARVELFARGTLPANWDGWGDEFQSCEEISFPRDSRADGKPFCFF